MVDTYRDKTYSKCVLKEKVDRSYKFDHLISHCPFYKIGITLLLSFFYKTNMNSNFCLNI